MAATTVAVLGGCVGSSRATVDYQRKAVATTELVESSVRTVELAAQAAGDRRAFGPYLSRVVGQAEDDATSALGGFETVQPPADESDDLRTQVEQLASDAIDVLAEARITIRRDDVDGLAALAEPLRDAGDQLEQFGEEHKA
ncbi:MAG: hypothetical protein QOI99_1007 [Actinomycetota bacterium]|nr:hypothetical protein [Actinomycetota bacterium]